VHTYLSACCADPLQRPDGILAQAKSLGRAVIGFSDHLWMNPHQEPNAWYRPQDARQIVRLREDLRAVDTAMRVLVGCEADTLAPGRFSITAEFARGLDFVNLSCSHFHIRDVVQQPPDADPRSLGTHLLTFFVSAVQSGFATTIVHPLLPCGSEALYDLAIAALSDAELLDALAIAAAQGVALEITPSFIPPSTGIWSLETPLRVLTLAKCAGCRFTFGSDAHSLPGLARLELIHPLVAGLALSDDDLAPITKGVTP